MTDPRKECPKCNRRRISKAADGGMRCKKCRHRWKLVEVKK